MKMVNRIYNRAQGVQITTTGLLEEPGPLTWQHFKQVPTFTDLSNWRGAPARSPLLASQVSVLILQTCRGFIEHLGLEEDWTW